MDNRRRTFLVGYVSLRNGGDWGFGSISVNLLGPLNVAAVQRMRECISETNSIPLDTIVPLSFTELEADDEPDTDGSEWRISD